MFLTKKVIEIFQVISNTPRRYKLSKPTSQLAVSRMGLFLIYLRD